MRHNFGRHISGRNIFARDISILFLLTLFTVGCADLLEQLKPKKEDDLVSVKQQVEELRSERADRNVTIDDLRVRIQLVAGEIDSTKHTTNQKFEGIEEKLNSIEGRLASLEEKLTASQKKNLTDEVSGNSAWSQLWEEGEKYFDAKKYATASEKYEELLKTFPKAPIAGKAQFRLGEALFERKKYADAILAYEDLKSNYPTSPDLPRAYIQQARSFANLGKIKEAKLFYGKIKELYPKSPESKIAEDELKALK